MRCQLGGRAAVLVPFILTSLVVARGLDAAAAPGDDGEPGQDLAIPVSDAEKQLAAADGLHATTLRVAPIDDFRYTPQRTEGHAKDVCYGRLRPGTARAFLELQRRFGGSPGTLYACRERWNAAEEPDCNGTLVSPLASPDFYSTCWSNHAQGRAFDLMSTKARGDAVVNWLLAPDAKGNYSAMARRLGVMQILWWDRCWNTDDDRGVLSVRGMRKCGIGHFDHVHVDLTIAGAMGRTSYWGGKPRIAPKLNGLLHWNANSGAWHSKRWFLFRPRPRRANSFGPRWDRAVPGDWDKDGVVDDLLLWDRDTGRWALLSWSRHVRRIVRRGTFLTRWDELINGDFDGNGRQNDLFLWDRDTGEWGVRSFFRRGSRFRTSGAFPATFDQIDVGDLDEDNRLDDMFVHDRQTGTYQVVSWSSFLPTVRSSGQWPARFTQIVIGDWDSDGELNDLLRRDRATGDWTVLSWNSFRARRRRAGTWPKRFRQIIPADLDAEGRIDDMLLRWPHTGRWQVVEWSHYRWKVRRRGPSDRHADQIIAGSWGGGP